MRRTARPCSIPQNVTEPTRYKVLHSTVLGTARDAITAPGRATLAPNGTDRTSPVHNHLATLHTEELAVDLLSHLHILQHTLLQQLQSARARRNAAGGYNGGWAVEAAMDRTGAIRAP